MLVPRTALIRRTLAVVEVLLVFAAVHVAFRSFRQHTALGRTEVEAGLTLSPGVIMIAATVALIALRRRSFAAYGLSLRGVPSGVSAGLTCVVALFLFGLLLLPLGIGTDPRALDPLDTLVGVAATLAATGVVLWWLREPRRRASRRTGRAAPLIVLAILVAPIMWAAVSGRAIAPVLVTELWLIVGAGIGEEVFFRGYIQSRVNEVFGRPFCWLGTPFGGGLIIAGLLFGLIHALNPLDYFAGRYEFAWGHGLITAVMPYGFLRERTGCVVAPIVVHILVNTLLRYPSLLGLA